MVISKRTIQRIRDIIDKHYSSLSLRLLGQQNLPREILEKLAGQGIDVANDQSIPEKVYLHNWHNRHAGPNSPKSLGELNAQQASLPRPKGDAHQVSVEHLNSNFFHLVEQMKAKAASRIEGVIRDNNNDYKMNALQNLTRPDELDQIVKEATIGGLKRRLQDLSGDMNRDWARVAATETSNAIGLGAVDRIVSQNRATSANQIYVYRVVKNDGALCKYCRQFYLDSDGTPKVYKLSTLLSNGSNYGKKAAQWKPVAQATHPNERCSQPLELKPGWKVLSGGRVSWIGLAEWENYIREKI